jgi:hypothetical protein
LFSVLALGCTTAKDARNPEVARQRSGELNYYLGGGDIAWDEANQLDKP